MRDLIIEGSSKGSLLTRSSLNDRGRFKLLKEDFIFAFKASIKQSHLHFSTDKRAYTEGDPVTLRNSTPWTIASMENGTSIVYTSVAAQMLRKDHIEDPRMAGAGDGILDPLFISNLSYVKPFYFKRFKHQRFERIEPCS